MPNTPNYSEQGGAKWVVGGEIDVTGMLKVGSVDKTTALAAAVTTPIAGVAASYKIARGMASLTGTAEITSGLATVVSAVATLAQDASVDALFVSVSIPAQTGGNAGKFTIKSWKPTATGDVTPGASTETGTAVSWIAIGT